MKTIIERPENIDKILLDQLIDLIEQGGQVQRSYIEKGIENADLIALLVENNVIISSATLKNPLKSYKERVFQQAGVGKFNKEGLKELGYIVTNSKYEGQRLCQKLLNEFLKKIHTNQIFATTRKESMIHILEKFEFKKMGQSYKVDLHLLSYNLGDIKQY
ncbi:hypothetical protein [Sphingobacterium sp. 18053]|uniref:hypothetical protein n=1 Tax=Sphingobacterium sp. 18053 TaxID=2681401 RepID=UPI00135875F9|nr:hypothetical protein [Sphingobacterium sp. 18053]